MFTKSLSVSLMISLSIDLILFMKICLSMKNDGIIENIERYSQYLGMRLFNYRGKSLDCILKK